MSKYHDEIFVGRCLTCGQVVSLLIANATEDVRKQTFREWVDEGLGIERLDRIQGLDGLRDSNCQCREPAPPSQGESV